MLEVNFKCLTDRTTSDTVVIRKHFGNILEIWSSSCLIFVLIKSCELKQSVESVVKGFIINISEI